MESDPIVSVAAEQAQARLKDGSWPRVFFAEDKLGLVGQGRPAVKGLNFHV